MKNKVLIIFKYPRSHWNIPVINQFSSYYDTEHLFINDYKNKNFTEVIIEINNLIKSKNIQIVVFDVDYFKFTNFFFIERINANKKILITGDDFELHELNSITASACDLVLNTCPLSVLKYKEKGYEAHIFHFEYDPADKKIKRSNLKKEIDVLFFGALTPDRSNFLEHIEKKGINLKNIGHKEGSYGLPDNELKELIDKSKIILNLSKSRTSEVRNYSSENIYKFYYQLKARVLTAGLKGVACVSEYSPGQELLFNDDQILTFFTKDECAEILQKYLADDNLLENYTSKFSSRVNELCDFSPIFNAIEKPKHRRVKLIKFPYWYLRIAAKQIILRNIRLSTLLKALFQFKVILSIIKNSNFFIKLLIILESILNTLWYSIVLTFKPKK